MPVDWVANLFRMDALLASVCRFSIYGFLFIVYACTDGEEKGDFKVAQQEVNSYTETAQIPTIVQTYCGSCHVTPNSKDLPVGIWEEYVLPRMGHRLGIFPTPADREAVFALDPGAREEVSAAGIYPTEPLLSENEWEEIKAFYLQNGRSDQSISAPDFASPIDFFTPRFPDVFLSPPSATLAQFLPDGGYVIGDANKKSLFRFGSNHQLAGTIQIGEGPTAYRTAKDGNTYVSVIGSFSPTDVPLGAIWQFTPNGKARAIIKHLRRPTDIAHADFDGDGQEELVIPEFGKLLGRLAVWQRKGTEWFAQVLDPQPGATRVITTDWNEDGHTDILALMAQGDERIVVYLNNGNGQFQGKTLLRFPPSYSKSIFPSSL
ncbi:MAG: VCBS repeat-containing protein [Bacteroidota bacterium]